MNSFQSLLNSYSHLRKRTYSFQIDEVLGSSSRHTVRKIDGENLTPEQKERINKISMTMGRSGYKPYIQQFIQNFPNAPQGKPEGKPAGGDVWITKNGNFNFHAKNTGSLPTDFIEEIMHFLEKGGSVHDSPEDAMRLPTVGISQNQIKSANNMAELNSASLAIFDSLPNPDMYDPVVTFASLQFYPEGTPEYTITSQFQRLLHALQNSDQFSQEELEEATLELQKDAIDLLKYFKDNNEMLENALATGDCIPPDPKISKLRERFFISVLQPGSKSCLSYGNFQGEATTPSKFSSLLSRRGDTEETSEATQAAWAKSKEGNEQKGRVAAGKLGRDPSNAIAICAQDNASRANVSKNGILQMLDKYKDIKICAAEGEEEESLFHTDRPDVATQLTSTISETSSEIVDIWRRRNLIPDNPDGTNPQRDKLDRELIKLIDTLERASERDCEQLKDLVKIGAKGIKILESPPAGTPTQLLQIMELFRDKGLDNDVCGMGGDFRTTLFEMLGREISSPVQQVLHSTSFEGEVRISNKHPDDRSVNQITGKKDNFEGIYPVPWATRCIADRLIIFRNKNDLLAFFDEMGIDPESPNAKIALEYPVGKNKEYVVPLSDKFYTEDGWTSQGKMVKENAYNDPEFLDRSVESTFGPNDPLLKEFQKEVRTEASEYLSELRLSELQLINPDLLSDSGATSTEIDLVKNKDRNTLDEFIAAEIALETQNTKARRDLEDLQEELKEFDKLSKADPSSFAAETQRKNLAHKISDFKRAAARRTMSKTERHHSEAAAEHLNRLATTGSAGAVLNIKSWANPEAQNITEDGIRELNATLIREIWNNEFEFRDDIKKSVKGGTRRTNRKSGAIEVALTGSVHIGNANPLLARIKEAKAKGR